MASESLTESSSVTETLKESSNVTENLTESSKVTDKSETLTESSNVKGMSEYFGDKPKFTMSKLGLSEDQNFPKRSDCASLEEFQEKTKQSYEKFGLR